MCTQQASSSIQASTLPPRAQPRHKVTRRDENGGDVRSQNGIYARLVSLEGLDHAQLFVQSLGVGESAYPDVWWTLEYAPPRVAIDL